MPDAPLTIQSAAAALRSGQITSKKLTVEMLDKIEHVNPLLGAYIAVSHEEAMAAAAQADADLAVGIDKGPLQGIPIGVKDIIATKDAPSTANSRVLDPAWGQRDDAN